MADFFANVNWNFVLLTVALTFIIFIFMTTRRTLKEHFTLLDLESFRAGMRKAQLIDIRKKDQYEAGHINGSRSIPLALLSRNVGKLRKDQPVYLITESNRKAKRAATLLIAKNVTEIYALDGGIDAWDKELKSKK